MEHNRAEIDLGGVSYSGFVIVMQLYISWQVYNILVCLRKETSTEKCSIISLVSKSVEQFLH